MAKNIALSIEHDLGLPQDTIQNILLDTARLYSYVRIGSRFISIPSSELKLIQTWIAEFVQQNTEALPHYVTAYEVGSSILANAKIHAKYRHTLSLDIKHFFQSCSMSEVTLVFSGLRYKNLDGQMSTLTNEEAYLLARLSCYQDHLAVGSPSSPFLANRAFLPVDKEIISLLPDGAVYSRYSDDICISSNSRLDVKALVKAIDDKLAANGFSLNEKKIHIAGTGSKRKVTGVYLGPDGLCSIGVERKKRIKNELYQLLVHNRGNPNRIMGLLNFCRQIEPDYYNDLLAKYANYGIARECGGVISALSSCVDKNSNE